MKNYLVAVLCFITLSYNGLTQERKPFYSKGYAGDAEFGILVKSYPYGAYYPVPQVLLVSPVLIKPGISHSPYTGFTEEAVRVSHQLGEYYRQAAEKHNWMFLDASSVASASDRDKLHLHMEKEDHRALAEALAAMIRDSYSK